MSVQFRAGHRVFVYRESVDMRCGFNKLSMFIKEKMRGVSNTKECWSEVKGLYESTEITVPERVYEKVINERKKYKLKDEYNDTGKEVIITARGPTKLKLGCRYSIDFALSTVSDKYEYHLPLERQRRKMESVGLEVDVKTLYRLCETVAEKARPVAEEIKKEIMNDFCATHLDESPWRILGDKKSGYMSVMSNRAGSYYQFEPTRTQEIPKEMLKGYTGAIVTDGSSGYNSVRGDPKIRAAACWSDARREVYERWDDDLNECGYAIEVIDLLFAEEAKAKNLEDLRKIRKENSPLITRALHEWMTDTLSDHLPESGLAKAIKYSLNRWDALTLFLKDLTVTLSKNDAERALRHAVLGRKNFAGSKKINGADTAATLYTMIESCKTSGIQLTRYLNIFLKSTGMNDNRLP
jgi:transposase